MKKFSLNILGLVLGALYFADDKAQAGVSRGTQGSGYTPETIFGSLKDWSPSQFREAVSPEMARDLRNPLNQNTLLHGAIEAGNVDVTRMLVNKPYALDPSVTNGIGETAIELAKEKGGQFDGIFKDIVTE